jgi:hypothetical protein
MMTYAAHARPGTLLLVHIPNPTTAYDGTGLQHRFTIDSAGFRATADAQYTFDRRNQLLVRTRTWLIAGQQPQTDFVRFRLIYPKELEHYLTSHGFNVLDMYDNTVAEDSDPTGPALYVLARFGGDPRPDLLEDMVTSDLVGIWRMVSFSTITGPRGTARLVPNREGCCFTLSTAICRSALYNGSLQYLTTPKCRCSTAT